jgi:hypothetical protein
MARSNNRGRGWFDEPERHAAAGRKGGRARGRKRRNANGASNAGSESEQ